MMVKAHRLVLRLLEIGVLIGLAATFFGQLFGGGGR